MAFLRLIAALVLLLAAPLAGAATASHGLSGADMAAVEGAVEADMADDGTCCHEGVDRTASCPILVGIAPLRAEAIPRFARAGSILAASAHLPDGREPLGLLDPPRLG